MIFHIISGAISQMLSISLNLNCQILSEETLIARYDAPSQNEKDILLQSYLHKYVVIPKI